MSSVNEKKLFRYQLGGLPLLHSIIQRIGLREILSGYLSSHGNEKVPIVDTLILLVYNLALGKEPLYKLEEWVERIDKQCIHLSEYAEQAFGDDRFGRGLDKLYEADRASMMTEIVLAVAKEFDIQMDRIHNDSTSVKAYGQIPGKTKSGLELRRGHSKDHRPDLKQLVFSLSISSDGAIPVHYKSYSGNRTDDTTHIETWKMLRKMSGKASFLYVADCKVCTDEQLTYIVEQGGRVVTIIPETWKEVSDFKEKLRKNPRSKKEIWRKQKPRSKKEIEYFSCFDGDHKTYKRGYNIHWIFSSEKKKRDQSSREDRLKKAEQEFTELNTKLNAYHLKEKSDINAAVETILKENRVESFFVVQLGQTEERSKRQLKKGRPGVQTQYQIQTRSLYTLTWYRDKNNLEAEHRLDGIFPLLSTDSTLSSKEVLQGYKYQPVLEKRFSQFKSIHNAAPLFFKNIERVEANMFLFFLALIVQALLEREIRYKMEEQNIPSLYIYPEDRESKFPTTSCVMNAFNGISRYEIMQGNEVVEAYKDKLSDTQNDILNLIGMRQSDFWNLQKKQHGEIKKI